MVRGVLMFHSAFAKTFVDRSYQIKYKGIRAFMGVGFLDKGSLSENNAKQ